jgi:hypothetical protein
MGSEISGALNYCFCPKKRDINELNLDLNLCIVIHKNMEKEAKTAVSMIKRAEAKTSFSSI